jgi:hypothetical protein
VSGGTIAVCAGEHGRWSMFSAALDLLERPAGTVTRWHIGGLIAVNRTEAVREMVGGWAFFVDDDIMVRPDTLTRLLAHDVPVVSAAVCNRRMVSQLSAHWPDGSRVPFDAGGLVEVGFVSTSALLIRREAFDEVGRVFRFDQSRLEIDGTIEGEDYEWCRRAQAAGVPLRIDLEAPVGHITAAIAEPTGTPFVNLHVGSETFRVRGTA